MLLQRLRLHAAVSHCHGQCEWQGHMTGNGKPHAQAQAVLIDRISLSLQGVASELWLYRSLTGTDAHAAWAWAMHCKGHLVCFIFETPLVKCNSPDFAARITLSLACAEALQLC